MKVPDVHSPYDLIMANFHISIQDIYGAVFGYVAPPYPNILSNSDGQFSNAESTGDQIIGRIPEIPIQLDRKGLDVIAPVSLRRHSDNDWWVLPIEPIVSVSGKNIITRRQPSQKSGQGTIKERWARDDYSVSIKGVFIGAGEYPEEDIKKMKDIFEHTNDIAIISKVTSFFDIHHIVIQSISFPNTPGIENQAYDIKAYSDITNYELIQDV